MAVTKNCFACGKEFSTKPSHAPNHHCCCRKCGRRRLMRLRQIEIEQQFNEPIFVLLTRLYHFEQLGIKKIAKKLGVSDHNLWDWFDDLGIERRTKSDAVVLQWQNNDERRLQGSGFMKTMLSTGVINNHGSNNPAKQAAARIKIKESKLGKKNWMHGRRGPLNPMWGGGKVYYYGASWPEQRDEARKRDNYTCQRCGLTGTEYGRQLDVHHIVKFRNFGLARHAEANQLDNLVCVCTSCHHTIEHNGIERLHDYAFVQGSGGSTSVT